MFVARMVLVGCAVAALTSGAVVAATAEALERSDAIAGGGQASIGWQTRATDLRSSEPVRVTRKEAHVAKRYWTEERMANAVPMRLQARGEGDLRTRTSAAPAAERHGFIGGARPGGGSSKRVVEPTEGYWQYATTVNPARPIGRLFFRAWSATQQRYYRSSCTATVVSAENRATLWTAGHCVYNTFINEWNSRFIFCPGYRNGNKGPREVQPRDCRLGKWAVKWINTTPQWKRAGCSRSGACSEAEFDHDMGAVTIRPLNRKRIENRVGSHVLRYNSTLGDYYSFGYPAVKPFNGRYLYTCIATNVLTAGHLDIPCTMTGGSSGGPWLTGFNPQWRGWLDSVNSHGGTTRMHGPYQGLSAQRLYDSLRQLR